MKNSIEKHVKTQEVKKSRKVQRRIGELERRVVVEMWNENLRDKIENKQINRAPKRQSTEQCLPPLKHYAQRLEAH